MFTGTIPDLKFLFNAINLSIEDFIIIIFPHKICVVFLRQTYKFNEIAKSKGSIMLITMVKFSFSDIDLIRI
jgi:hypothetical protein